MANPFFNAMMGQMAPQPQMNIFEAAQQLKKNPMGFLLQRKLNVPASMLNNPTAMLNYLVQTNQVSQAQADAGRAQLNQIQNGGLTNYGR